MLRSVLLVIGAYFGGLGVSMWLAPELWYELTPGVVLTGPFNLHFVRDIAMIFLVSGCGLIWGALRQDQTACVFGVAWPVMRAVFHFWIWGARGGPMDQIGLSNLIGIQLPAWLAVSMIVRLRNKEMNR